MAIVQIFKDLQVSPRVSFWVSIFALVIVLFNNHVVMTRVDAQEKKNEAKAEQNIADEKNLARRERLLRAWETELINREREVRDLISEAKRARSPQLNEKRD